MEPRYWLDIRTGCAAIRDRQIPSDGRNGLDSEIDVVAYVNATMVVDYCPTCKQPHGRHYVFGEGVLDSLKEQCDKLNNPT